MFKIGIILGTRPEIIKFTPIIRELIKRRIKFFIIHTNQHYTANMDRQFFSELNFPDPNYDIGISFETYHGRMTGKMLIGIEEILIKEKPKWILVQGDTNTALAGALTACKMRIKVGHVEAGLRSYDMNMPEEVNRILVDRISDALFCPTNLQQQILLSEGIDERKIFVTGNTIVDALEQNIKAVKQNKINLYNKPYILLTLHRPSNVDNPIILKRLIKSLERLVDKLAMPIIFPIHPRTAKQLENFKLAIDNRKILIVRPVGYLEMLAMEKNASLIITDSGGLQEEACILGVPCLTLRKNTERPETLDVGSNILVGSKQKAILDGAIKMLKVRRNWRNPFGDGTASQKIISIITNEYRR